jgi:hypothetical protein
MWEKDRFTTAADPGGSIWSVESFTRESVVIRRTDTRPRPYSAVYKAKISTDGDIINGEGYMFTWGAALNSIPGTDGPAQAALTRKLQPNQPQNSIVARNLAALMLLMGTATGGSNDLPGRISQLRSSVAAAEQACINSTGHSGVLEHDPGGHCADAEQMRDELDDAQAALADEIKKLWEAQKKLGAECKAGNKQSCQKLDQVNKQLARDGG